MANRAQRIGSSRQALATPSVKRANSIINVNSRDERTRVRSSRLTCFASHFFACAHAAAPRVRTRFPLCTSLPLPLPLADALFLFAALPSAGLPRVFAYLRQHHRRYHTRAKHGELFICWFGSIASITCGRLQITPFARGFYRHFADAHRFRRAAHRHAFAHTPNAPSWRGMQHGEHPLVIISRIRTALLVAESRTRAPLRISAMARGSAWQRQDNRRCRASDRRRRKMVASNLVHKRVERMAISVSMTASW